jgi:hypothetical protein
VIVQHMSPTHRSLMAQLLGRTTKMPVLEVSDGCMPQPDTVYVTPPNTNVVLHEDGSLRLREPPNETVPKPSVNLFFTRWPRWPRTAPSAWCLSGTGSDGAIGLHAIKAAGGFSFAQEPGGAKYDGMARAAIEAGGVDWVLPAESIGAEIARIVQRQQAAEGHMARTIDNVPPATLQVAAAQPVRADPHRLHGLQGGHAVAAHRAPHDVHRLPVAGPVRRACAVRDPRRCRRCRRTC